MLLLAIAPWVIWCACAGLVTAVATREPASYAKSVLVGAVIGIGCGVVRILAVFPIADLVYEAHPHISYVLPRLATSAGSIAVITGFAAATGAMVAWLAARSTHGVGRCAAVGAVYGLAIGVADAILTSTVAIGLPPDSEGATSVGASFLTFVIIVGLIDVGSKAAITAIGFVWARRFRRAS